ncbi:sigma-70 family RNA polymerase sigma factor [Candidatus Poribacteria bacterium]|nr:sigma-70 family RNA polymerase sigma factor [Candidatus Poribacteria bacterium]
MKTTDVDLIHRVLNGDDAAFTELVKKYQKPVHALVWRKIGDFHIAEEITQDTFLKAYQELARLKKPQSFASWLYVIAANNCSTWLRKKRLWTEPVDDTRLQETTYSGYVVAENERVTAEAQREAVKKLLAKLQESERTVITLYYFGEMSSAEIGAFLGVSANTVRSRLRRAQQRLKREEPMIREALENFQITPNLTENIMRKIERLKPAAPSGGKPLVPWAIGVSTVAIVLLMLGLSNQSLLRFQKPYSFDTASEMKVELIDAPVALNLESEPDDRTQLGNANAQDKNNGVGNQVDAAASLDLETIITKMKHYDNAVTSITGDFVIERGMEINEYTLAFEGEKVWVQPKERRASNLPDIDFWDGERQWGVHRPDNLLFKVEIKPNKESPVLEKVQQAFKQVGIELAADVRIAPAKLRNSFRIIGKEKTYFILFVGETMLEVYDGNLEYDVRPHWAMIYSDQDPRFWLTFPDDASTNAYLSQPLWQLLEKHESELIGTEILNGEKVSIIRLNRSTRSLKLWISHDKGFRLVRSEETFTVPPEETPPEWSPYKAGVTYISTRVIAYHEYLPDVWFPKVMVRYHAPATSSGKKEEDFISKTVVRTRQCRLNVDVSELFRLELSPDTPVYDYAARGVRPVGHVLNLESKSDIQAQPGSTATPSRIDDSDQHAKDSARQHLQQLHLPEGAKSRLGKGQIRAITYSPDGRRLGVASSIGIWLYDTHSGQALDLLTTHTDWVNSVAFSADGKTLASGSKDGIIHLWDAQTGILRQSLIGHTGGVASVLFSADGKTLVSGSKDNTIRLWDTQTGELQNTLKGHTNEVFSVVFGPNGKTLASGSKDNTIRFWDAQTGELQNTLTLIGHKGEIWEMAFSPDGKTLATWSWEWESPIHLWDVETGARLHNFVGEARDNVNSMAFSPDGNTLASPLDNGTIRLWNTQTGELSRILIGHTYHVSCVAFSPDGEMLASGSYDGTLRLWDAETGELRNTRTGYTSAVVNVSFSPDGKTVASAMGDDTVGLWNAQTGTRRHTLKVARTHSIESLSFSPDNKTLAGAGYGRIIHLWDAETGALRNTLGGHTDVVAGVSFSPDGKTLASGSKDKTIHLWDVETGALQNTLKGHTAEIGSVAFSPDGKTLASASKDGIIHLWDVETGTIRQTTGHLKEVESVAFSPDGNILASASWDKTIHLYDVQTDTTVRILEGHAGWVRSVAFSSDGNTLMSGSQDGTLLLWEITPDTTD